MKINPRYTSAVTNQPFLFQETLTLAQRLQGGESWAALSVAVIEENILNCRSQATRKNVYQGIAARLKPAAPELVDLLVDSPLAEARLINFLLCLGHFRLLRELMAELVVPLRQRGVSQLTAFEAQEFFAHKRQTQDTLYRWQESTFERVKSNTLRLALDAEVLQSEGRVEGPWQIGKPLVPPALSHFLRQHKAEAFIPLLGQEI